MFVQKNDSHQGIDVHARRALSRILECGIPLSPESFSVWHGYYTGSLPDLTHHIDQLIASGQTPDAAEIEKIFSRFLSTESESDAANSAVDTLSSLLRDMLGQLSSSTKRTREFAEALDDFRHMLDEPTQEGTKSGVARIIEKTRAIREEQIALCRNFDTAAKSIAQVGSNLGASRMTAAVDELTGVPNWLSIHKELRRRAIDSTENGEPLSVVLMDIDGFTRFNDQNGRDIGNSALCLLANILREGVGSDGMPGRYGADEFVILMPGGDRNDAAVLTERLRQTLSKRRMRHKRTNETFDAMTIAAAVGEYEVGEALVGFIRRIGEALERAKDEGGNRIAFAEKRKITTSEKAPRLMQRPYR